MDLKEQLTKIVENGKSTDYSFDGESEILINTYEVEPVVEELMSLIQHRCLLEQKKVLQYIVGTCPGLEGSAADFVQKLRMDNLLALRKFKPKE